MRKIRNELGIDVQIEPRQDKHIVTALEFPYTLDLCLGALQQGRVVTNVLQSRGINDSEFRERLFLAAEHFMRSPGQLPILAIQMATANHLVKFVLPKENLHITRLTKSPEEVELSFSAGNGNILEGSYQLPPPTSAERSKIALWNRLAPHAVIIAVSRDIQNASLRLRNLDTTFGIFNATALAEIRQHRLHQLFPANPQRLRTIKPDLSSKRPER